MRAGAARIGSHRADRGRCSRGADSAPVAEGRSIFVSRATVGRNEDQRGSNTDLLRVAVARDSRSSGIGRNKYISLEESRNLKGYEDASSSADATHGLRSFLMRVALIAIVLAVPVMGTGIVLVSQINKDLSLAASEHASLVHFDQIRVVFDLVDRLRSGLERGDQTAIATRLAEVKSAIARAQWTYTPLQEYPSAFWVRVEVRRARATRDPSVANLDALLDALSEAGNELEGNSPLDQDPNVAMLNLADLLLRKGPRSVVGLRQTANAVAAAGTMRLTVRAAERITKRRALEEQAISIGLSDIALAISIEPELEPQLAASLNAAQTQTHAFERNVDNLLASLNTNSRTVRVVDQSARRATNGHMALWRLTVVAADRIVVRRVESLIVRRRVTLAFACLAVLAGALAVTFVSRYEARRDRVVHKATKLEADRLRAEITRMSIERALRVQEAQFRAIFENADLGIATFDRYGKTLQYNAAALKILGPRTHALLEGQFDSIVKFQTAGQAPFTQEESCVSDAHRPQWLALTFSGVYDEGLCQLVILLIRDATEEKLLARQLAHDARHDSLTGLVNRAAFDYSLNKALADDRRRHPFAVMYIDLDKFKPINDSFGHRAGDHVLVTTAERLRSAVGAQDVCARLGGDEFAVLLRGVDTAAPIAAIAERVGASLAMPIVYDDVVLSVTASIGIAIGSLHYSSADAIKHDADIALYAVKERGRDGYLINERPRKIAEIA